MRKIFSLVKNKISPCTRCIKNVVTLLRDFFHKKNCLPIVPFTKQFLTVSEQISLLKNNNLNISDEQNAERKLKFISFYRLNGYSSDFRQSRDHKSKFQDNTRFDDIFEYYVFDRELRLLLIDALERIEIAVRTVMINKLSVKYGPHWYMDETLFDQKIDYYTTILSRIESDIKRSKGKAITHYYDKYTNPKHPPIWVIAEVLSFGKWSIMFANLRVADKKAISSEFTFHHEEMRSWIETLSWVRNLCAHHSRVWNVKVLKPLNLKKILDYGYDGNKSEVKNDQLYAVFIVMQIFMNVIAPNSSWKNRLKYLLLEKHAHIPIEKLGFVEDWEKLSFWR